ncbi:MAG: TIGR02452 family protein [Capsulimonadales bacterium]|nr:TIGR02452 family protein [Capsulimonadales bacterium]
MSLSELAEENLGLFKAGSYLAPSGRPVTFADALSAACLGTILYSPETLEDLLAKRTEGEGSVPSLEITGETTGQALRRLVVDEEVAGVVALNFASARNPGGGFLTGAKSQEEDLCRASVLYPCLLRQPAYYDANRARRSALYTDHVIYSPEVPFLRDEQRRLLEVPFNASFITAPAPNAGAVLKNSPQEAPLLAPTFARRIRYVLTVAAAHRHRTVVLGAWGCGAFRNDPDQVAPIFRDAVRDRRFAGAFDRILFAIYDTGKDGKIRKAFDRALS